MYKHKIKVKYDDIADRDVAWQIRDLYVKLIADYKDKVGKRTKHGVKITEDFLKILVDRYNQLSPRKHLEL